MKIRKISPGMLRPLLPPRLKNSHKGNYGNVLVVAGSRGMTGAAVLAARAVMKAGAGLVTVACPEAERRLVTLSLPEATTFGCASKEGAVSLRAAAQIAAFACGKKFNLLLIGPGLSTAGEAASFTLKLLKCLKLPAVVDADALNAVSLSGGFPGRGAPVIITPHPGEAGRLLKAPVKSRREAVVALSRLASGVCVLKGCGTLVSDGVTVFENTTGGPSLAKGGSGDVLAGLCAGLWAQAGMLSGFSLKTALESAALAVYLHGLAGDIAADKFTERGVLASDIIDALPAALRRVRQ